MKTLLKKLWAIKKKNDFLPSWYSILISPYFLIRAGLYKKIETFSHTVKNENILDVGCGSRPYEGLFKGSEYIGIDVERGGHKEDDKNPNRYFDGENIPYKTGSFDLVICTEVLEHARQPEKLVAEIARVLRNKGRLYLTVPFVWNEHEVPYDFRRLTRFGLKKILATDFIVDSIEPTIGTFGVAGQLISASIIESFKRKNFITYPLISLLLCFPVQLIFLLLEKTLRNEWITSNWIAVARKKG